MTFATPEFGSFRTCKFLFGMSAIEETPGITPVLFLSGRETAPGKPQTYESPQHRSRQGRQYQDGAVTLRRRGETRESTTVPIAATATLRIRAPSPT
jgi:hypothetical protein